MNYIIDKWKKVFDKCIAKIKTALWLDRVEINNYKHYTILNNINNQKVKRCIDLSFEYQKTNNINDQSITNSILFYDILKCFGYFFQPVMILSVGSADLVEHYTPHMVNYCSKLNMIIDTSWINYLEVTQKKFWYSFYMNNILEEAVKKKIITNEKRFNVYTRYYEMNKINSYTVYELDYCKKIYYNNVLNYIKNNTKYTELKLLKPVNT